MSEQTPQKVELLSQAQIDELERQVLENEAAKERGESPPHVVTKEQMKAVVMSLRATRGTVQSKPKKAAGEKAVVSNLNIDDL